ncbi:hypothetical protein A5725_04180 [Mycobacterium kubicae]|uniref:SGNH/GDSL hydrolase family protein n=1 Tax=Mycobacterium kubicae TaxID=120959 RepID=UPI000801073C|nr:SGNH/GDSL hydrolase family protein [Mycobacterium kubicae]OBF15402.1 hypothetical protein A5725_04180 [Mycobacterium kubicae]
MGSRRLVIASVLGVLGVACAPPGTSPERLHYVALGDSVAADPGVPDPGSPEGCHKSTNNYPSILARRLKVAAFVDATCSGATTDNILRAAQQTSTGPVDPQIESVTAATDLVTITIGANDIELVTELRQCEVKSPDPTPCKTQFVVGDVDRVAALTEAHAPSWATLIDRVRAKAHKARIILVGYGILLRPGGCYPAQPVLPQDSDYLQSKLNDLDDRQRKLAADKGTEFFDTRPLHEGHDMCAAPADRYVEGYVTQDPAVPLHPTPLGAAAVGDALADYVSRHR